MNVPSYWSSAEEMEESLETGGYIYRADAAQCGNNP